MMDSEVCSELPRQPFAEPVRLADVPRLDIRRLSPAGVVDAVAAGSRVAALFGHAGPSDARVQSVRGVGHRSGQRAGGWWRPTSATNILPSRPTVPRPIGSSARSPNNGGWFRVAILGSSRFAFIARTGPAKTPGIGRPTIRCCPA